MGYFLSPLLVLLTVYSTGNCESYPVVISRGAFIKAVEGVTIYNDVELYHHVISDLPEPPASVVRSCPRGATEKSCALSTHLHNIMEHNSEVLTLLNKARTTYGLTIEELPTVAVPKTSYRAITEEEVKLDPPDDATIRKAGRFWYADLQSRLEDRRPIINNTKTDHKLNKRWVQYVKPMLIGAAAAFGVDDLFDFIQNLFMGETGIAKFLATLEATSPDQSFVDLSTRVSQFESTTRQIVADMAADASEVKKITEKLQDDVLRHKMDLSTVEDSHIASQQLLSDLGTMVFTYGIYFSLMHADALCRSGYLSPLLLPPNLLAEKLAKVAATIPSDMRLAITLDQIQNYYTSKCAHCIYDSNGGITIISIPLVHKQAQYKLFEYRNIFFRWEDLTCTLESNARYIIKDVKNNKVYPLESLDETKCSIHQTKRCRVPPESDSAEAYCLTLLLSSSTVSQIREACKMTCFKRKEAVLSKLSPNLFVATHLKKNSLTIKCPNHEVINVTDDVQYGSLRIITPCACSILLNGKTVERSAGPHCEGHEAVAIDKLLPGHWTTLEDFLPFNYDGELDSTKFQHEDEVFNQHYMDTEAAAEESVFTTEVSVLAVCWNFIHSLLLAYILFRLNIITGAGMMMALSGTRMVEASDRHLCRLDDDIYYILYVICALCSLAFVPPIIYKFYNFLSRQFWDAVDHAADLKITEV